MIRGSLLAGLLLLVVGFLVTSSTRNTTIKVTKTKSPRLSIKEFDVHLGVLNAAAREPKVVPFRIENHGDAPLVFDKIQLTCSCVTGTLDDTTVQAGGSTYFRLTVKPSTAGFASATATLVSNDTYRPEHPIRVRWEMVAAISVTPSQTELNYEENSNRCVGTFVVQRTDHQKFDPSDVKVEAPDGFRWKWKSESPMDAGTLCICGSPSSEKGHSQLRLVAVQDQMPVLATFSWHVPPQWKSSRSAIIFRYDRSGDALSESVLVSGIARKLNPKKVACDLPGSSTRIKRISGDQFEVTVTYTPPKDQRSGSGRLMMSVEEFKNDLEIPVFAYAKHASS